MRRSLKDAGGRHVAWRRRRGELSFGGVVFMFSRVCVDFQLRLGVFHYVGSQPWCIICPYIFA